MRRDQLTRQTGRMRRRGGWWAAPAALALAAVVALAGCGGKKDAGATNSPTTPAPPNAVGSSPTPASPLFRAPAKACDALPAEAAAQLKATKSATARITDTDCTWDIDSGDKYKARSLAVTYTDNSSSSLAKRLFESGRKQDSAHGRGLGGPPTVMTGIAQIGTQRKGTDFDEGYYTHYLVETAGMTLSYGRVVLLKGNVVIDFAAEGHDILPPYTGKLKSRPLPSEELQQVVDKVADALTKAVTPAN